MRIMAGDLVDQVKADEELGLSVRKLPHRMGVPDLLEEVSGHDLRDRPRVGSRQSVESPAQESPGQSPVS